MQLTVYLFKKIMCWLSAKTAKPETEKIEEPQNGIQEDRKLMDDLYSVNFKLEEMDRVRNLELEYQKSNNMVEDEEARGYLNGVLGQIREIRVDNEANLIKRRDEIVNRIKEKANANRKDPE